MNYKIKIKSKNQMFLINGRSVRSPFETILDESSLKILKSNIKYFGLKEKDYEIIPLGVNEDYSRIQQKKVKKIITVEPKILDKTSKPIYNETEKIKTITIPGVVQKNLLLDSNKKIEQNINKDYQINDTEVKLEELTSKSTSILSRILNGEF